MSDSYDNAQNTENVNPLKSDAEISDYSHISSPLLRRAFLFLEDGNFSEANKYCEKVLDQDPENAYAYLGELMAELHIRQQRMLVDCKKPFDNNNNYIKAIRFGDEKLVAELKGYISGIYERNMKSSADNSGDVEFSTTALSGFDENGKQDPFDLYSPALIEKEIDYYKTKFSMMEARGTRFSWNWCAFLFSPSWFLYRKMYLYGIVFLGISILESAIGSAIGSTFGHVVEILISLADIIFRGTMGNYLYYRHLRSKVEKIESMKEEFRLQYIIKNGGTSIIAIIMAILIHFLLALIINR